MGPIKVLKFVVTADCCASGGGGATGKKPFRKQGILVHSGDEVRRIEWFLKDNEQFMTPGEYRLAPDAVYIGESTREHNGRTYVEPQLRVSPRFVPFSAAPAAPGR